MDIFFLDEKERITLLIATSAPIVIRERMIFFMAALGSMALDFCRSNSIRLSSDNSSGDQIELRSNLTYGLLE